MERLGGNCPIGRRKTVLKWTVSRFPRDSIRDFPGEIGGKRIAFGPMEAMGRAIWTVGTIYIHTTYIHTTNIGTSRPLDLIGCEADSVKKRVLSFAILGMRSLTRSLRQETHWVDTKFMSSPDVSKICHSSAAECSHSLFTLSLSPFLLRVLYCTELLQQRETGSENWTGWLAEEWRHGCKEMRIWEIMSQWWWCVWHFSWYQTKTNTKCLKKNSEYNWD